jgi:protein-disulfide isomerase
MSSLRVPLNANDHIRGGQNPDVVLLEYGDYQCPFCGAAQPVVHQLEASFDDRMALAFRHLPLTEAHPFALPAAETAEFAGSHGRFWDMHEALFANQPRFSMALFYALASNMGLSQIELRDAMARGTYLPKIQADFISGVRSGVNGTPTFFINGERYNGPHTFEAMASAMRAQVGRVANVA